MLKTAAAASFRLGSEAVAPHRDPPHHFKRLLEPTRRGYVLIGVLLLLLAGTGLGHTLLVMTRSELLLSRARWDVLTRRVAAEAGRNLSSRAMTRMDSLPWGEWIPLGSAAVPPRARYAARAVRLSQEVLLILAEGSLDTEPGRDRQVGLYWAMDPVARYSAARAILESGEPVRIEAGNMVDPSLIHDTPVPWPETSCTRFSSDMDTLFTFGLSPLGALNEDPRAEYGREPGSDVEARLPSMGLLGHDALTRGADLQVSGAVSPGPIRGLGRCGVPFRSNWGAPLDASDPCSAYRPVVKSEGSLIVHGGQGQGVLLITGDAVFRAAARYYGVVVVAGDLEITGESEIHGLVRVRGAVFLGGRSRIVGSACAALAALDAAEQLREDRDGPDEGIRRS